jgi:predicted DNA-binding transcriptional regulator AlpA
MHRVERQFVSMETLLKRWDLKSRQSIYARMKKEPDFPKPIKFGAGMTRFDLAEIEAYEAAKAAEAAA